MDRVEYTEKAKKELYTFEWNTKGNAVSGGLRGLKMARPICEAGCQGADAQPGWWATCKHGPEQKDGSPYWRMRQHVKKVNTFTPVLDAEGKETGEYTSSVQARVFFTLEPNISEVAYSQGHSSGRGPGNQRLYKGWKFLEEVGVAPMCMLFGCGKAWPTYKVGSDYYCSEAHARAVGAREQQVFPPTEGVRLFPGVDVEEIADQMLKREVVV